MPQKSCRHETVNDSIPYIHHKMKAVDERCVVSARMQARTATLQPQGRRTCSTSYVGVAYQQSPASICCALTPRTIRKKPFTPQYCAHHTVNTHAPRVKLPSYCWWT